MFVIYFHCLHLSHYLQGRFPNLIYLIASFFLSQLLNMLIYLVIMLLPESRLVVIY